MRFSLAATNAGARAGVVETSHGAFQTPAFMPVGTQAAVKALTPEDLRATGAQIILSNTYHLSLRPGIGLIERMGGLHRFMGWSGPILTDSGGFQVFSLGHMRRLSQEGVVFRSHLDGSLQALTPEQAITYQEALGSDIAMALDHCPAYGENEAAIEAATERTHAWAARCLRAHTREDQALFGIVQGGWSQGLRQRSAQTLAAMDFPGYAIGGVSVGEPQELAYAAIEWASPYLPRNKPRYLMGVGSPEDLINAIARGIDMFDCALPTRVARNGGLFTSLGRVNLRNAQFSEKDGPVEEGCDCYACQTFSTAYLRHLLRSSELLYYRLASIHNLRFILRLVAGARTAVLEGRFATFAKSFLDGYKGTDQEVRLAQKAKWLGARLAKAP